MLHGNNVPLTDLNCQHQRATLEQAKSKEFKFQTCRDGDWVPDTNRCVKCLADLPEAA